MISCNALREVRTFCWIFDFDAGVKNFLKRLGVTVGGLIGFLEASLLVEQAGGEAGILPSVWDMVTRNLVDGAVFSCSMESCSSRDWSNRHCVKKSIKSKRSLIV